MNLNTKVFSTVACILNYNILSSLAKGCISKNLKLNCLYILNVLTLIKE